MTIVSSLVHGHNVSNSLRQQLKRRKFNVTILKRYPLLITNSLVASVYKTSSRTRHRWNLVCSASKFP